MNHLQQPEPSFGKRTELICTSNTMKPKLFSSVNHVLSNRINSVSFWTDSTITLSWIKTSPHKLKTHVANRVADIQRHTSSKDWDHVPSSSNPTDLLSRGTTTEELRDNYLWWHGPLWLVQPSERPIQEVYDLKDMPETKREITLVAIPDMHDILYKFSSTAKLRRIIAYCMRFINNLRSIKSKGSLSIEELEQANIIIIRLVQRQVFEREIEDLRNGREIYRKSKLLTLRPFLDEQGLIRVGGRIRHAEINIDQKHPYVFNVLPSRHHITTLILREEHKRLLHCGPEQLLASIRLRYWPLLGRQEARKVTRQCLECFRLKPKPLEAVMADLPKDRLQGTVRPFAISGIDYAGPIQIRKGRRRGRISLTKGYIALFVCFHTKAVHLEAVTDLTTEAFLAALRRFTSRRGLCTTLYSDNATNFVGAARELKEIYQCLIL
ncbi:PREDICTED: uncharacterized protein LOC108780784 [Cyphomyrmex costatus]|uniref:uncharacterized protein LOC108780784 n=1 Tax=Cyphomyrmex costatus TaxID=456900 RepID=UPI00085228F3|nr:PREDICTED: uncharacterized protein LOC108780784 [Cyphomyrmex costatus]